MATNQTQFYKLNQWEPTDAVLRVDFNADNAKLDSALHDLAARKEDTTQVDAKIAAESQARAAAVAAETQARNGDVARLREEQMWVKVGEATAGGSTDTLSVTIQNADRYLRYSLQYSASGPCALALHCNGSLASHVFSQNDAVSLVLGRLDLLYGNNDRALMCSDTYVSGQTNYSSLTLISTRIFSGSPSLALKTERSSFSAGSKMTVYALKK